MGIRKLAGEYDSKLVQYLRLVLVSSDTKMRYTNEHLFCGTIVEMMDKGYSSEVIEYYDNLYAGVVSKNLKSKGLEKLLGAENDKV